VVVDDTSLRQPVPVLRALPLGAGSIWLGRAAWAPLAAGALALVQVACARPIYGPALGVLVVWLAAATLAIALLGAHYGITLGARAGAAQRFLMLTLGIAMAASLMVPLMGWIVLFTAVIHSGRRVPRWARLEDER